jgi:hypothetical protein
MPSINDVFNELQQANGNLQQIHTDIVDLATRTDNVADAVAQAETTLHSDLVQANNRLDGLVQIGSTLIGLQTYANRALYHHSLQTDTVICLLDRIAREACEIQNEAHVQTGLQLSMAHDQARLRALYEHEHAAATLQQTRIEELRTEIQACCPPEEPEPACEFEPCPTPPRIDPPPNDGPRDDG